MAGPLCLNSTHQVFFLYLLVFLARNDYRGRGRKSKSAYAVVPCLYTALKCTYTVQVHVHRSNLPIHRAAESNGFDRATDFSAFNGTGTATGTRRSPCRVYVHCTEVRADSSGVCMRRGQVCIHTGIFYSAAGEDRSGLGRSRKPIDWSLDWNTWEGLSFDLSISFLLLSSFRVCRTLPPRLLLLLFFP